MEAQQLCSVNIGVTHVIAIAKPADGFTPHITAVLQPGLHVSQKLAGMILVR
ncbi:MAG: Uncharacterised protein [Halieaceae bacterium]|nr:MAG: Uncharacterised protein [Halieaceae bacterium]